MSAKQWRWHNANDSLRSRIRGAQVKWLESTARLSGDAFRCRALSGESAYNIAINADLSISCNCDDSKGEGRIGSLKNSTFEAVFRGPRAQHIRSELASGRLPLSRCVHCPELDRVSAQEAATWVNEYTVPPVGVMLENNAGCNLSCVACYRELRPLERLKMRIEDLQRVVTELKDLGVRHLSFFNLGEPFMSKNILEEMKAIRAIHPTVTIFTSTNGVLVDSADKRQAALMMDQVVFSLDGSDQESVTQYQIGSNFDKAYENLQALVHARNASKAKTIIRWKYIVFRWNDRAPQIERAERLAIEAGVDTLEFSFTKNPLYGVSHRFFHALHFLRFGPLAKDLRRCKAFTDQGRTLLAQP